MVAWGQSVSDLAPTVEDIEREFQQRDRRMIAGGMAAQWAARERGPCPEAVRPRLAPQARGCAHCWTFGVLAQIGV